MGPTRFHFNIMVFFLVTLSSPALADPGRGRDLDQGRRIYLANCAQCHGIDAKGTPGAARSLQVDPPRLDLTKPKVVLKPRAETIRLISGGHGKMPKQKRWLTQAQIRAVVAYLQSLQKAYASGNDGNPIRP